MVGGLGRMGLDELEGSDMTTGDRRTKEHKANQHMSLTRRVPT